MALQSVQRSVESRQRTSAEVAKYEQEMTQMTEYMRKQQLEYQVQYTHKQGGDIHYSFNECSPTIAGREDDIILSFMCMCIMYIFNKWRQSQGLYTHLSPHFLFVCTFTCR